jgi:hypothetical protein
MEMRGSFPEFRAELLQNFTGNRRRREIRCRESLLSGNPQLGNLWRQLPPGMRRPSGRPMARWRSLAGTETLPPTAVSAKPPTHGAPNQIEIKLKMP